MKKITLLAMSLMMALMMTAQEAATDVTDLFTNTDFETGDTSGWDGGNGVPPSHNSTAAVNNFQGTHFMEAWVNSGSNLGDFDWSQTVDMPNGYYVVKALAHAIKQNQSVTPEPHGVYVYAEDKQVEVTTTAAADYTVFAKVTDGALTIGYRGVSCDVNWVVVDYFRVIQCAGDTEADAKISWIKYEVQDLAATFEEYLERDMSQALKDEMEAAIGAIESISTYAEADELWTMMKQLKVDAEACIEAYEQLALKIDEVFEFIEEEGADDLYDIADEVSAKFDEGALDAAEALAEIEALDDAVFEYNLENADGSTGFSVTELFVTNPSLRSKEEAAGWTIESTASNFPTWNSNDGKLCEAFEFWNCDYSITQTIADIPNGKYKVRVQGFQRAGNVTAELFANDKAVRLVRLDKYSTSDFGSISGALSSAGLADNLTSAEAAFNVVNMATGRNYYDENELEVIVMDGNLTFGVRNQQSEGGAWTVLRDFQLYYYGNFPAVNLYGKSENIKAYIAQNIADIPYAVNKEVSDYLQSIRDYTTEGKYSDDVVNGIILQLDSIWAQALEAIDLFAELKALATRIEKELLPLKYPGQAELNTVLEGMAPYFAETSTVNTYAGMQELKTKVEAAIMDYYFSQVATPEQAADYTFLLPNPNFEQKGNWTWSMSAGGTDQWIGNCRPAEVDGASRRGVNLWGWGIKSIDVHQRLTGLPDGLYKVSAELITENNYATDQHVYATSGNKVASENLAVAGWDSCKWTELKTTDYAVVIGGRLTIGAESSIGGTNSEGWFQATNFKLYYHGAASAEQLKAAWENTEARANDALEVLIPNEKKELAAAMEKAVPLAAEGKYGDACALVSPIVEDLDSTVTATKNFYADYYARLDTIRLREGYENCEKTYAFADATIAMVDEILASDTATCKLFDDLNEQLHAYAASYASSLRFAEQAINDTENQYPEEFEAFVLDSVVAPQTDSLLCKLRTPEFCNDLAAQLDKAVNILKSTLNITKDINVGDVTYLIVNPTIDVVEGEDLAGWTAVKNNAANCGTNKSEHYSGKADNTYLDAWNGAVGTMNATFYQEIIGIPDGTYKLTVAARTDGDNAYIFAATTASGINNDTTKWEMVKNYGAWRGEIWETDSLQWVADGCPEEKMEEDYPYFMARPDSMGYGTGYGWSWHVIDSIEVTNHFLSIGLTADNTLTGKNFTATWMGADDWKLELVKKNENQSEFNPFANYDKEIIPENVEQMESASAPEIIVRDGAIYSSTGVPVVVYSIDGKRAATTGLSRGIYIVICGNTVTKVVVR